MAFLRKQHTFIRSIKQNESQKTGCDTTPSHHVKATNGINSGQCMFKKQNIKALYLFNSLAIVYRNQVRGVSQKGNFECIKS